MALNARDMQFFLQNIQNKIFKILKMFINNMKFTRTACWLNSKISNKEKNATLMILYYVIIVGHYYGIIIECF